MDARDKQRIIERYKVRLEAYGVDVRALASGNRERQQMRFKVLADVGNLEDQSILDIGCGFADFYTYLKDQGLHVQYTGIDICPQFINICQEQFPDLTFLVADIQTDTVPGTFDYIVSSQTFNNALAYNDNEKVLRDVLTRSYALCRKGVVIDMLTKYVDFKEPHLHYYSPEEIFSFCKSLTKRVALRHDYPLFEFAVYLYKDFQGWGKK
ncbi:class I SAM-dependent methyltransferase [Candidatus Uhrbacteria bacterium]|nr:class I SAM-dependent methyltransferase [Candidatus Uhrbacteria bacterium]